MLSRLIKCLPVEIAFIVAALALTADVTCRAEDGWTFETSKAQLVDAVFEQWNTPSSPGAAVGVVRRGKLLFSHGYGSLQLNKGGTIQPDSLFYIASTSKQFTAAGIALLAIDGVIDLNEDIRKWIPELVEVTPPITVQHLLHHTSGIPDYGPLMLKEGRTFNDRFNNGDTIETLARHRDTDFKAGDKFAYCNSNYVLLAEILERASGMTIQEFSENRIFQPLGMKHSKWGDNQKPLTANQALSFALSKGEEPKRFRINFNGYGDGNLWTTVEDLALWEGNFFEPKVGGNEFLKIMLSRGRLNNGKELDYALGLSHGFHKGQPTVSHAGGLFGYSAETLRFPKQGLSVIVLANLASIDAAEFAKQVADIVLTPETGDATAP